MKVVLYKLLTGPYVLTKVVGETDTEFEWEFPFMMVPVQGQKGLELKLTPLDEFNSTHKIKISKTALSHISLFNHDADDRMKNTYEDYVNNYKAQISGIIVPGKSKLTL